MFFSHKFDYQFFNKTNMLKKSFSFALFILLTITKSNAQQRFIFQHEIGAEAGISNFQGDFVSKGPFDGKVTINGFALNAVHYLHLLPRSYGESSFFKHTILKTSLGINYSTFDNTSYGTGNKPLSNPLKDTPNQILLARLSAKTIVVSLDNELQVYYRDIIKFLHRNNRHSRNHHSKINPYASIGLGIHYVNATPTYGKPGEELAKNDVYPDNYKSTSISKTNTVTFSGNLALGARYKASSHYDLVTQINIKYYLSDGMDGVNPNTSSNKSNDFNSVISLGFVYHMF